MFKFSALLAIGASALLSLAGCQKKEEAAAQPAPLSADVLAQVKALGFGTSDLRATDGGFVVEGDILLTPELLASAPSYAMMRVGADEQYRTTNLVSRLPRTLTVSVSSQFSSAYVSAADEAIRRYNAANLQLRFTRITSGTADLPIKYSSNLGSGVP
ncbi:MAG: protease, partial [Hymenobacter sp.]